MAEVRVIRTHELDGVGAQWQVRGDCVTVRVPAGLCPPEMAQIHEDLWTDILTHGWVARPDLTVIHGGDPTEPTPEQASRRAALRLA